MLAVMVRQRTPFSATWGSCFSVLLMWLLKMTWFVFILLLKFLHSPFWFYPHIQYACYVCLHFGHEHESNKTIFALRFAVHGSKTWPLKTGDDVRCRWPSSCHRHFSSCVARFQSVLKSQRVAFLRVNSIPCDVYVSLEMTGRTSCFRFVGHKGHNSKGCNLHCCGMHIASWGDCIEKCKQTGKPMTQLRSKQQWLERCKFHRISHHLSQIKPSEKWQQRIQNKHVNVAVHG